VASRGEGNVGFKTKERAGKGRRQKRKREKDRSREKKEDKGLYEKKTVEDEDERGR
jgi:hypothetical protein